MGTGRPRGCGGAGQLVFYRSGPRPRPMSLKLGNFRVTSPALGPSGRMDKKYGGDSGKPPHLEWSGAPMGRSPRWSVTTPTHRSHVGSPTVCCTGSRPASPASLRVRDPTPSSEASTGPTKPGTWGPIRRTGTAYTTTTSGSMLWGRRPGPARAGPRPVPAARHRFRPQPGAGPPRRHLRKIVVSESWNMSG